MIYDVIPETKMQLSDNIVRHKLLSMSAKASDVLRHFSHQLLSDGLIVDWSEGLIYFSGFMPKNFATNQPKSDQELIEIIALCPKWLLSAHVMHDCIHTI